MIDLAQKETEILSGLKDFQNATVERVHHLFTNDFSRVLVADEVGLGKTMIARGVIARIARYHREQLHDPLFKVVYVCSNQNIARQNLKKLRIDPKVKVENSSDTRLSMQHLKIFENDFDPELKKNFIQLIPLTPSTSFNMTSGCGSAMERALIFSILKYYAPLKPYINELELLMMDTAFKGWKPWKNFYEEKVGDCNTRSNGKYCRIMFEKVDNFFIKDPQLFEDIDGVCKIIKQEGVPGKRVEGANKAIYKMRRMMAEISVNLMNPDLVIMDEFQRFPELVNADGDSETALLANKFFNSPKTDKEKVKILLLSATPYKLYSTLEEISETGNDEHYKEFMQVTDFLFEHHPIHQQQFKKVWDNYSMSLSQVTMQDFAVIKAKKQEAENSLYQGIARTERMAVKGASELISASKESLEITEGDILSYVEMDKLVQEIGLKDKVPVEYVKSAPFLMAFMEQYKLKQKITESFKGFPEKVSLANKPELWINKGLVSKYKKLPETNARLTKLKDAVLTKNAERLLWVPPSLPYYEFGGSYEGQSRFSKVLVFSAWEMVPRSIATLLSYEAERLTVGELIKKSTKKKSKKRKKKKQKAENRHYFSERRFPQPRLTFMVRNNVPANMNHLTLLYPSVSLAKLFNPTDTLKRKLTLREVKEEMKDQLQKLLEQVPYQPKEEDSRVDEKWYYMAPILFDLKEDAVKDWFDNEHLLPALEEKEEQQQDDKAALTVHLEAVKAIFRNEDPPVLGRKPDDLLEVLANMAIGSPAVCVLRMLKEVNSTSMPYAVQLAKTVIDRFNTQEAISVVELEYWNKNPHWQNVLRYCVDGNVQAMMDEYAHMLLEEGGLHHADTDWRNKELVRIMNNSLKTHTASYHVDTYEGFKERVSSSDKKNKKERDLAMRLRTNYAVGFSDTRNEDTTLNRKSNVRAAFNSPFRPFVLATTSIGQEGLDFHYYCRKVFHWNLPSNPIDLEQREGRINRYKSFAIRQNIASKYGNSILEADIWQEMFSIANDNERDEQTSELVPFWSLPDNQDIKIERIIPMYPLSKDGVKYERLMKILALYRLSLGQARQEELIEYLFSNELSEDDLNELFINLSPYHKEMKNRRDSEEQDRMETY